MPGRFDQISGKETMNTPHEDLRAMLRIRQYLQEAQDWARESGVAPNPAASEAASPAAPASVVPLIDASAERADDTIRNMKEKLETPEAADERGREG